VVCTDRLLTIPGAGKPWGLPGHIAVSLLLLQYVSGFCTYAFIISYVSSVLSEFVDLTPVTNLVYTVL
jgi:hypothetical protein